MKAFAVRTTSRFDHALIKLSKQHAGLPRIFKEAITLLKSDPHNVSREYPIKKLRGVKPGEGQYRLRVGRWRFRYDIWDQEVELSHCGLRREDTYRQVERYDLMRTYTFRVVVEPDEGGFHAYCPALRRYGAVTQGATHEEHQRARANG